MVGKFSRFSLLPHGLRIFANMPVFLSLQPGPGCAQFTGEIA